LEKEVAMKHGLRVVALALLGALPLAIAAEGAGSGSSRPAGSGSSHTRTAGSGEGHARGGRVARLVRQSEAHLRRQADLSGGYLILRDGPEKTVRPLQYASPHHGAKRIDAMKAQAILARIPGARPDLVPVDAGPVYFVCHDMKDARSKAMVDLDVWMVERGGRLEPVQYLLHKVGEKKRFKYRPEELGAVE
jgi:hypothetical protein